ncbi:putative ATP-binding protein [Alkaliphilus metalliredigens QYMF]|uniref:Putative ATP-binding protein n=1 Tax=Alkaliphilus metalliredigens (strain QYMF) TaxID=293826 RepID=A6TNQ6_ALKMQ|nr:AAA family ATPase [Alkaliphilus metalliredigens]ABR47824.1 putative ATP-binding protein [Alkaliphilus metalliredigens QYMF]
MRVGFFGKGGSGKTTATAGFISYLKDMGDHVLAVDADMNVHLGKTLQMEHKSIGDAFDEFEEYLEGHRRHPVVENKKPVIIGTTPPALNSRFIRPKSEDPFIKTYATQRDNISLITVGTYRNTEVGHSCYHGKLGALELMYNRLLDDKHDIVVADSTAGVDSVGTSMFFVYDIIIFVVEPTLRSLNVYLDFLKITKNYSLNVYVLGNKVTDEDDINFLKEHIGEDKLIGCIKHSSDLRRFEQGDNSSFDEFINKNQAVFETIHRLIMDTEKNWDSYYERVLNVYKAGCQEWYNNYYSEELEKYIDPEFNYTKVVLAL